MKKAMMFLMGMGALNSAVATDSPQNLIVNGDFSQSPCASDFCIYNQVNAVTGWTPDPEIEVGYGSVYSNNLGNERVVELAPNFNSCIRQSIKSLQSGCYQLKFEYAARKERAFDDCSFAVSLNGNTLKTITPADYQVHSEVIDVEINSGCEAELKFCGVGGQSNSYGAVLKSVSLVRKVASTPIYTVPQLPPIVVNIPVLNPPVLTPPPLITNPVIPQPVLPTAPVLNLPTYNIPTFQLPTVNFPVINAPVLTPPPIISIPVFDPSGFYVESHSSQCFGREYTLAQGGQVEITFDYKVLTNFMVRDSAIIVTWDGKQIQKILPCDSGKTISIKVNASKGCHQLGFCASGCPTQSFHQASICNVALYEKQCIGGWGNNNLIVNGDFEQTQCAYSWCIWNAQSVGNSVPGWTPSPEIEIGKGTVYNNALGTSWVAELDPNASTCIKQKIALQSGKHQLGFDWAGRSGISADSNQFDVKLNGQVLKSIKPADSDVHRDTVEFQIDSCPAESTIEFCGTGASDSYGSSVDNIKLAKWDQCATYKIVKY